MFESADELTLYDYNLPRELIASHPPAERDTARLLLVNRQAESISHHSVRELPDLLSPGDCLVLNDTRVVPARLFGRRTATGGRWEGLYLGSDEPGRWRLIGQTRGRLKAGESITLLPAHHPGSSESFNLTLEECDADGVWTARPAESCDPLDVLARFGTVPLPPYLNRPLADEADWEQYQTVYARRAGAVAAPTAGLHFTPELLEQCRQRGIGHAFVTLHVGIGTFRPIAAERLSEHRMHSEWCELSPAAAASINRTRAARGRIIAVGTTTVRTLESAAQSGGRGWTERSEGSPGAIRNQKSTISKPPRSITANPTSGLSGASLTGFAPDPATQLLQPFRGQTDLFIRPPWRFRSVDVLLTNFHLPRSTLLVLVSAFAGRELVLRAYDEAIGQRYRFYSFGDAMLIL